MCGASQLWAASSATDCALPVNAGNTVPAVPVRLAGSGQPNQGRLEVFWNAIPKGSSEKEPFPWGLWATARSASWDAQGPNVVCK